MLIIALLAVGIGVLRAGLAVVLLRLIAFFTNLFFYQRLATGPAQPADHMADTVPTVSGITGYPPYFQTAAGSAFAKGLTGLLVRGS
jgi:hypothetical protein